MKVYERFRTNFWMFLFHAVDYLEPFFDAFCNLRALLPGRKDWQLYEAPDPQHGGGFEYVLTMDPFLLGFFTSRKQYRRNFVGTFHTKKEAENAVTKWNVLYIVRCPDGRTYTMGQLCHLSDENNRWHKMAMADADRERYYWPVPPPPKKMNPPIAGATGLL